jgi:hypothetical protein
MPESERVIAHEDISASPLHRNVDVAFGFDIIAALSSMLANLGARSNVFA